MSHDPRAQRTQGPQGYLSPPTGPSLDRNHFLCVLHHRDTVTTLDLPSPQGVSHTRGSPCGLKPLLTLWRKLRLPHGASMLCSRALPSSQEILWPPRSSLLGPRSLVGSALTARGRTESPCLSPRTFLREVVCCWCAGPRAAVSHLTVRPHGQGPPPPGSLARPPWWLSSTFPCLSQVGRACFSLCSFIAK